MSTKNWAILQYFQDPSQYVVRSFITSVPEEITGKELRNILCLQGNFCLVREEDWDEDIINSFKSQSSE